MKTYIILLFTFFSVVLAEAQEKKITFTKLLDYQFVSSKKVNSFPFLAQMYTNTSNENLTKLDIPGNPLLLMSTDIGSNKVAMDFDNRLLGNFSYDTYRYATYTQDVTSTITFEKTNEKETILGYPCENFLINFSQKEEDGQERQESSKIKVCIDTRNSINNTAIIGNLMTSIYATKTNSVNTPAGLIIKIGPEEDYQNEYVLLQSIKETNKTVFVDQKKIIDDQKKFVDSLIAKIKQYDDYSAIDSAYAVADSAAYAVDSAAVVAYDGDDYYDNQFHDAPNYQSTYKDKIDYDDISLAISTDNKEILATVPKYCSKLDEIPTFENKDVKKHVFNYIGQICDLYLLQNSNNNVGVKITIDQVRLEALNLMKLRDKLSKKDLKQLDKYLDKLD